MTQKKNDVENFNIVFCLKINSLAWWKTVRIPSPLFSSKKRSPLILKY